MKIKEFLSLAKKRKIKQIEIIEKKNQVASISIENETLHEYNLNDSKFYTVKVEHLGKIVSISSNKLTSELLDQLEEKATYQENKDLDYFTTDTSNNITFHQTEKLSCKEEITNLLELSKLTRNYPEIYKTLLEYEEQLEEIKYYNSNGVILEDGKHTFQFLVSLSLSKDDKRASSYETLYSTSKKDWDKEQLVKSTIQEGLKKLESHSIISNHYPVIIKQREMSELFSQYLSMFSAETIQKKQSPLEGKLNTKIFSSLITIKEEPNRKDLPGYRFFDDEGMKTKDRVIVEKGVLKDIFYNNKTAKKDNRTSTGNGYQGILPRNLSIEVGDKSFEELLKQKKCLIVITGFSGLHCGINQTNGDFSLQAEGYLVKDGKRIEELKLLAISDNIFTLLNKVESVGNDIKFKSSLFASPSILFTDMMISGSKD